MENAQPLNIDPTSSWETLAEAVRPRNRFPTLTFQHRVLQYHINVEKLAKDLLPPVVSNVTLHKHLAIILDSLLTSYQSSVDVDTTVAERLHDRLGLPENFRRVVSVDYTYNTFDIGLVGGPALFTGEYEEDVQSNAKYFFLCFQEINGVREKIPTVPYTYTWVPGAVTYDEKTIKIESGGKSEPQTYVERNVVAWSLNDSGPGFILREKIKGEPVQSFLARGDIPDTTKAGILFQLVYTVALFQEHVKGMTLDHSSIVVRDIPVQLSEPLGKSSGDFYCTHLVGITNFREIAVQLNKEDGKKIDIGYRDCAQFKAEQEVRFIFKNLAPETLESIGKQETIPLMLQELLRLSNVQSVSVIMGPVSDSECSFYNKYYEPQPLTEIGYIDMRALLSDEAGGTYIGWINEDWKEDEVIAQATDLIQYYVELCRKLIAGGHPIITETVVTADINPFIADLGELSAHLFSIISLINGVMNAVYLSRGQGEMIFPMELMAQVQSIMTFHAQELENIDNVLAYFPAITSDTTESAVPESSVPQSNPVSSAVPQSNPVPSTVTQTNASYTQNPARKGKGKSRKQGKNSYTNQTYQSQAPSSGPSSYNATYTNPSSYQGQRFYPTPTYQGQAPSSKTGFRSSQSSYQNPKWNSQNKGRGYNPYQGSNPKVPLAQPTQFAQPAQPSNIK